MSSRPWGPLLPRGPRALQGYFRVGDTIASVDNATVYTQLINDTVILLKNDSTLTKGYLTSLYGSGTSNFGGYLPTVAQIPNVTNVDLGIPTYVELPPEYWPDD